MNSTKAILSLLFLMSSVLSFSQANEVVGEYNTNFGTIDNASFEYKLTLSQDGTFLFSYNSNIKGGIPVEVQKYGRGKWSIDNQVISFSCDKQKDINEQFLLDFNNSKARFIQKSPRDKSDKIIKTKLQFVQSEISWMKRIALFKN